MSSYQGEVLHLRDTKVINNQDSIIGLQDLTPSYQGEVAHVRDIKVINNQDSIGLQDLTPGNQEVPHRRDTKVINNKDPNNRTMALPMQHHLPWILPQGPLEFHPWDNRAWHAQALILECLIWTWAKGSGIIINRFHHWSGSTHIKDFMMNRGGKVTPYPPNQIIPLPWTQGMDHKDPELCPQRRQTLTGIWISLTPIKVWQETITSRSGAGIPTR